MFKTVMKLFTFNNMFFLKNCKEKGEKTPLKARFSLIEPGFLLIELMVSLMIMLVFSCLLYGYYGKILEIKHESIKRYEVINIINSFLAKANNNSSLLQDKNYCQNGVALSWTIENFAFTEISFIKKLSSQIQCLVLKAEWYGYNNKKHAISLKTGIKI